MDLDNEAVSVDASVVFNDTEGDTLSFNATGLPPGLKINSTTGEISGMLDTSASAGGPYAVVVTADDGADTVTDTFTWAVDNPATEAADDVFNTDEDTPVFDSVAPNDSDPDTDSVTYAPATSPSNGSIVFNNDGTFTYTPKRRSVAAKLESPEPFVELQRVKRQRPLWFSKAAFLRSVSEASKNWSTFLCLQRHRLAKRIQKHDCG